MGLFTKLRYNGKCSIILGTCFRRCGYGSVNDCSCESRCRLIPMGCCSDYQSMCNGDDYFPPTEPPTYFPPVQICKNPGPIPMGGVFSSQTTFSVGEKVKYYCQSGYELVGDDTRTCTAADYFSNFPQDPYWMPRDPPECHKSKTYLYCSCFYIQLASSAYLELMLL